MNERLNFNQSVIKKYWEQKNEEFSKICHVVDKMEYWTADEDRDVNNALKELASVLENEDVEVQKIIEVNPQLFFVLAYIKFSKAMRLITWLDEKYQEEISQYLVRLAAEKIDESVYRLMIERLMLIKDFYLLRQIYSEKRMESIKNILNKIKGEMA